MTPLVRRPAARALVVAWALLGGAIAIETAALASGTPPALGPIDLRVPWLGLLGCAVVVATIDFLRVRTLPVPDVERVLPASLALHDWATVRLLVDPGRRDRALVLVDSPPPSARTEGLPLVLEPTPGETGRLELRYRVRPDQRGDAAFGPVRMMGSSPAGLWRYTTLCGAPTVVRVYPNFATVARYDDLIAEAQTTHAGIVRRQRRGEGTEFHQLREYRPGDPIRHIDWKATSRKQTPIAREYEDERDQRVVFVLDSSRRMRAKDGDLSHFDHSLNAMILLAHVALRGGDAVGFLSFGEQTRWLPPAKGVGRIHQILGSIYDLEPTTLAADFRVAARELGLRAPRRSLVIVLTTLRAEDAADLQAGLAVLQRRHLVLVANLRPEGLDAACERPVDSFGDALRFVGAAEHQLERRRLAESLQRQGVLLLDCSPAGLTPRLVSSYLAVKRSGRL